MSWSVVVSGSTSGSPEQQGEQEAMIHDAFWHLVHGGVQGVTSALFSGESLQGANLITDPCVSKVGK